MPGDAEGECKLGSEAEEIAAGKSERPERFHEGDACPVEGEKQARDSTRPHLGTQEMGRLGTRSFAPGVPERTDMAWTLLVVLDI